jgi:hypothetical protein
MSERAERMADATIVAAAAGAAGVLAGSLVSGLVAILRERLVSDREREARADLRLQQRADDRALFQRESILEFLDAMSDLFGVASKTNEERLMDQVETGQWPDQGPEAPLPTGFLANYRRFGIASARLFDRQLRDQAKRLQGELGEAVTARTAEEERSHLQAAGALADELQDRTNALLDRLSANIGDGTTPPTPQLNEPSAKSPAPASGQDAPEHPQDQYTD